MKMKFKRFLSGVMAVATLASVIVQPVAVSASELEPEEIPFEQQYPKLTEVQDSLDPDEVVVANDIEIAYGDEFEVEVNLSGIDGVDESKMKILFHEAKNADGADFDTNTPDTYKAVYAVEPVSGHPSYRISRNITVKEPETETQSESSSEIAVDDDSGTGDTEQSDDDSESHQENTVDTETELTVSEVLEQAETNGIDLYAMDAGEIVTFMASAGNARRSQQVSVTRGTMYRYADYGYGSYLTYQYTVKFGNISATAYCVQPSKPGLGSGTYTINKVGDGKALAKVCYYGTKASGDDGFFTEENGYGNLSAGARFMVHIVASYVGSEVCYGAVVQLVLRLLYIIYRMEKEMSINRVSINDLSQYSVLMYDDGTIRLFYSSPQEISVEKSVIRIGSMQVINRNEVVSIMSYNDILEITLVDGKIVELQIVKKALSI